MSPDFFSPTKTEDLSGTDSLKQRLYADYCDESGPIPCAAPFTTVEELKKLACSDHAGDPLAERIHHFERSHHQKLLRYFHHQKQRTPIPDNSLHILQGWHDSALDQKWALSINSRETTGGYFLRWQGKGIAINPGVHFLEHFHKQSLTVRDIDFVIVTEDLDKAHCDINEIYTLNAELNRMGNDIHIINYYLKSSVYESLHQTLKPNFKQERNTLHELTFFNDSPEVEKIELAPGICLHYFQPNASQTNHPLALLVELKNTRDIESAPVRVGFVNAPWNPLLSHHLGPCDILLAGFGNTCKEDYQKKKYNECSLGYFGTLALLEEIHPKLMICTEFGGREGDIRLEVISKLRFDSALFPKAQHQPVILPSDLGMLIDLKSLAVQCSMTNEMLPAGKISIMRSNAAFGPLFYLPPERCLPMSNP